MLRTNISIDIIFSVVSFSFAMIRPRPSFLFALPDFPSTAFLSPTSFSSCLGVSTDYLLTGDIIDKDKLLLSEKLDKLTPKEVRLIEDIIDECIALYHRDD